MQFRNYLVKPTKKAPAPASQAKPKPAKSPETKSKPPAPKPKAKASGEGKPVFQMKLQDLEVIELSAARFDVLVEGMCRTKYSQAVISLLNSVLCERTPKGGRGYCGLVLCKHSNCNRCKIL